MADPHHVAELDDFDHLTVLAYRAGIGLSALAVAWLAVAHARGATDLGARLLLVAGVAAIGLHLHLYAKRIRWVIVGAGWVAAVLAFAGSALDSGWVADAALGFAFVTLSGVALKERFCFRLPLVNGVPLSLAAALVPLRLGLDLAAAVLLGIGGLLLALLALAKARMPLHYDVGDRSKYEV